VNLQQGEGDKTIISEQNMASLLNGTRRRYPDKMVDALFAKQTIQGPGSNIFVLTTTTKPRNLEDYSAVGVIKV